MQQRETDDRVLELDRLAWNLPSAVKRPSSSAPPSSVKSEREGKPRLGQELRSQKAAGAFRGSRGTERRVFKAVGVPGTSAAQNAVAAG